MIRLINNWLMTINNIGETFCKYSSQVLVQSSVLIVLLLIADFLLRKRVRATLRYWMWMLVFVKLVLPPTLCLPTGIGYWLGGRLSPAPAIFEEASARPMPEPTSVAASEIPILLTESPATQPAATIIEPIAATATEGAHVTSPTWKGILFLLWLGGISAFSVLLLRRIKFVRRLIAQSTPADSRLLETLNQCGEESGIAGAIQLRLSTDTPSPAACGLLKPIILIPANLVDKLSPQRLGAVLLHELAHIKRGDLWINSAQTLFQIIYFYNPFLWLANAMVRRVREQAVDEMVLVALGGQAADYSNMLIDIAEMAFFKTSLSLRLVGVVESKKAMQGRIKLMLNRPVPKKAKLGIFGLMVIAVIAIVLLPMARGEKKEKTTQESNRQLIDKLAATLSNGVRVELFGVCDHPSAGKQWWRPDGTPIETHEFRDYDYADAVPVRQGEYPRLLALKFDEDFVQDIKLAWSLEHSRESRYAPDYADRKKTRRSSVQVILATFPEGTESTNLKLGVAAGPWKTVAVGTNGESTAHARDTIAQRDLIYNEAIEEKGRICISATHLVDADYDCRIFARGKDGEVYEPLRHSNSGAEMRLCKSEFDIPLEKVRMFHLQARPFQWMTFKNISLKSGSKTDAQAEVEEPEQMNSRAAQNQQSLSGRSLLEMIDSVQPGSTVIVPKGVYTKPIEITKSLILIGQSRTECIFEVTADKPAIFVDTKGKGKVTVENLTVKWQLATSNRVERPVALAVEDTQAEVKNCSFVPLGNFRRSPVAVRADGFSKLAVNKCRFEGFEYVICYGEGTEGITKDCLIMNCGHQGIINYSGSTLRVERNVITGSKYHAVRCTGGTLYVRDNLIIGNNNRGIYLGNKSGRGTIVNNVILDSGTGIGGFAGAAYEIKNNIIADSSFAGIGMERSCSLVIQDNIFLGNERGWIMFERGGSGKNTCYRNTFWQNKTDAENFRETANSIKVDPGFTDPDNGGFSLRPGFALDHKQGLTDPEILKVLWKRWKNRADKNEPFITEVRQPPKSGMQVPIEKRR